MAATRELGTGVVSTSTISTMSVLPVQTQTATVYVVPVRFTNQEDAEDFAEDMNMLEDAELRASFIQAEKESREKKAKPMGELYKKYGV